MCIRDSEKDWYGNTEATEGGFIEKGGISVLPRFALLVAKERYDSDKLYEICLLYTSLTSTILNVCAKIVITKSITNCKKKFFQKNFPRNRCV